MNIVASVGVILTWLFWTGSPVWSQTVPDVSITRFRQRCLLAHALEQEIDGFKDELPLPYQTEKDNVRERLVGPLLRQWEKLPLTAGSFGESFFRYYDARLQILASHRRQGQQELVTLAGRATVAPEAVDGFFEVPGTGADDSNRLRLSYELLGRLIPLSVDGRLADLGASAAGRKFAVTERPVIPAIEPAREDKGLVAIASRLFDMKLYDRALPAYVEAAYGSFGPPRFQERYRESWLSVYSAPLWLRAAECQWLQGHTLADISDYLAKAAVFGGAATQERAFHLLASWQHTATPPLPGTEPDAEKLKFIAEQYASMHMHPRAIEITHQYQGVLGAEAVSLQQRYEAEWLKLLKHYCVGTTTCTIFGQSVASQADQLKVVIPPPLRPEAVQAVAQELQRSLPP